MTEPPWFLHLSSACCQGCVEHSKSPSPCHELRFAIKVLNAVAIVIVQFFPEILSASEQQRGNPCGFEVGGGGERLATEHVLRRCLGVQLARAFLYLGTGLTEWKALPYPGDPWKRSPSRRRPSPLKRPLLASNRSFQAPPAYLVPRYLPTYSDSR